jgi:hypothetical protein
MDNDDMRVPQSSDGLPFPDESLHQATIRAGGNELERDETLELVFARQPNDGARTTTELLEQLIAVRRFRCEGETIVIGGKRADPRERGGKRTKPAYDAEDRRFTGRANGAGVHDRRVWD